MSSPTLYSIHWHSIRTILTISSNLCILNWLCGLCPNKKLAFSFSLHFGNWSENVKVSLWILYYIVTLIVFICFVLFFPFFQNQIYISILNFALLCIFLLEDIKTNKIWTRKRKYFQHILQWISDHCFIIPSNAEINCIFQITYSQKQNETKNNI